MSHSHIPAGVADGALDRRLWAAAALNGVIIGRWETST
jgi:hypothetical protein